MMFAQAQSPEGISGRNLLSENDTTRAKRTDNFADGDGWSQISVDSSDVRNAVSPFDDIGFLAKGGAPGKSFKIKESTHQPVDKASHDTQGNAGDNKGPSLHDFLANKAATEPTQQAQHEKKKDTGAGMLRKSYSKRGDLGNINDEESIGISTIASKMTMFGKGKRMFETSKGSLTLSVLGANRSKSISKSSKGNKSGSSDPSAHSKNSISAFGSSMFSRDSSKSKERMREMIEQLEGANKSLLLENEELCSKVAELSMNLERISHIPFWMSMGELAEVTTELCRFQALYANNMRTCEQQQKQIERSRNAMDENSKRIQELEDANKLKDERIAYLEAKLHKRKVDRPSSHHNASLHDGNSQGTMLESCNSFASFGFDDEEFDDAASYEEDLKVDGESTVGENTLRDERKELSEESKDNEQEHNDDVEEDEKRDSLGQALNTLSDRDERQSLGTLVELAEDMDSTFTGDGTKQSNENAHHKPSQPNSWLTLDTKLSDESSKLTIQPSSGLTMDIDGFNTSRRVANSTTGMPLESFMKNYKKAELTSTEQEAFETGTWAVSDIVSVQKEKATGASDFLLPSSDLPLPPPPPPSMRNFTDPDPCPSTRKKSTATDRTRVYRGPSEAASDKRSGTKDKCSTCLSDPVPFPTTGSKERTRSTEVLEPASQPFCAPVISTSRIAEKPRRARSASTGRKRAFSGDRSKKRMAGQSEHGPSSKGGVSTSDAVAGQSGPVRGIGRSASNGRAGSNPTTPTKQASRRRLCNTGSSQDPPESGQHSNKSTNGGLRRRPHGTTSDQLGAGSGHSCKSAGRRRPRCSVTGEKDRRAVSEAMERLVGSEDSMDSMVPDTSVSMSVPAPPPPPSSGSSPSSRQGKKSSPSADKNAGKRSNPTQTLKRIQTDQSELVSSRHMVIVQDNGKARVRRNHSGSNLSMKTSTDRVTGIRPERKCKSAPMA